MKSKWKLQACRRSVADVSCEKKAKFCISPRNMKSEGHGRVKWRGDGGVKSRGGRRVSSGVDGGVKLRGDGQVKSRGDGGVNPEGTVG